MAQKKKLNGMAENANDQYKYFASDVGSGVLATANTNKAYQAAQPKTINVNGTTKTIQASGSPKINTDPDRPDNTGLPDDDGRPPYTPPAYNPPTYTSAYAGAQYSYGGERPTWNGYQGVEPTYTWDQQAPTWSWDDSGRPGAFEWDDSGRPGEFTYDQAAPAYTNAYQDRINAMVDQILNRPQFSYDYAQDPLYAQYADAYTRNGTQAMNDTLAQVSARTGGLASSYASNAAQQQYNSYMNALNDKIPELYQLAYGMYRDQGNDMRSNLSMLQGLENTDYGRYMDALGQYNTDRNLAYNVWNSGLNQYNQDRNFAYNQYADQLAQYNTDRNFSYGQYQDALNQYNNDRNFSFDQYQTALNQYNNNRNFDYGVYADQMDQYNKDRTWDYNLWSDNISRQEAAAKAAYNSQLAAYNNWYNSQLPASSPVTSAGRISQAEEKFRENNDKNYGDISVIYSGGNTLSLKGPNGQAYNFSSGNEKDVERFLNDINNLPISNSRKQELLNQAEKEIDKFRSKTKY